MLIYQHHSPHKFYNFASHTHTAADGDAPSGHISPPFSCSNIPAPSRWSPGRGPELWFYSHPSQRSSWTAVWSTQVVGGRCCPSSGSQCAAPSRAPHQLPSAPPECTACLLSWINSKTTAKKITPVSSSDRIRRHPGSLWLHAIYPAGHLDWLKKWGAQVMKPLRIGGKGRRSGVRTVMKSEGRKKNPQNSSWNEIDVWRCWNLAYGWKARKCTHRNLVTPSGPHPGHSPLPAGSTNISYSLTSERSGSNSLP